MDPRSIAQFIKLANLRAQHSAQVMSFFAFHHGALPFELFHEKSPAHATILS
jgi:hypothetical protein